MRFLVGGLIAMALGGGAVAVTVAGASQLDRGGPYQIYIFDSHEQQSIYAVVMGERAAAASVEQCVGRLIDDPYATVTSLRERANAEDETLNLVWVSGEGSNVHLGECGDGDEVREEDNSDSLVIVRDASARQVRSIIRQIHGLPSDQQQTMIAALGLDQRRPARR